MAFQRLGTRSVFCFVQATFIDCIVEMSFTLQIALYKLLIPWTQLSVQPPLVPIFCLQMVDVSVCKRSFRIDPYPGTLDCAENLQCIRQVLSVRSCMIFPLLRGLLYFT